MTLLNDWFLSNRNKWYEFFKATHYLAALVFMVFLFIHCGFTLTSAYVFPIFTTR